MLVAMAVSMFGALLPQARQGNPTHRPEEFEYMFQKTGYVLPLGVFEGDVSISHLEFDDPDVDFELFVAELAYGVTEWLTVEGEIPFVRVDPSPGSSESGLGDLAVEAKASLREHGKNPIGFIPDFDVAVGARFTLPTGDEDDGTGEEHATLAPFVSGSYWIEPWVAAHASVFLEWQSERRPVHRFNVTGEFAPWMPELSLMAGLQIERVGSSSSAFTLLPGAEYRFPQIPLVAGASIPFGLNDKAPDIGFVLDVQYRF